MNDKREKRHQELFGEKVNLTTWELPSIDDSLDEFKSAVAQMVKKATSEVLELAIEYGGNAYFPIEWSFSEKNPSDGYNGAPVDDPNILYFGFPFAEHEHEYCHFRADLRDIIKELIEGFEIGDGGPITGAKERDILAKVSGALKDCALKLDEALEREATDEQK